ncbi:MAG: tripartite tricarboxylate transporter substrate binding protein [Burkholderiales bacterium]|nr:tripartite tricarboxylate transporter substrate binding protein [Burkholderiales bacterium]
MQIAVVIALGFIVAAGQAWGQEWRPERQVELVVPTAPGGGNDAMARLMQRIMQERKIVASPVLVMNKPGGSQALSATYLTQQAGSPHHLLFATATLFTNQIQGRTKFPYTDFAPLGLAYIDYSAIMVPANSPVRTMRELVERLKAEPESVAFSTVALGGTSHAALAQAVKAGGVDPRRLKMVVYKTSAEAWTALMGGHIQASISSVSGSAAQVVAGNIRMLAIAGPQRRAGPLADVPTLKETGLDVPGVATWRAIFGAKGITPAQARYWEDALAKVFASDEWQERVTKDNVQAPVLRGKELVKYFEEQYAFMRGVLVELALAQ